MVTGVLRGAGAAASNLSEVQLLARPVVLPRAQIHLIRTGQRSLLLIPRGAEAGQDPPHRAGTTIALQPAHNRRATIRVAVARVSDVALRDLDEFHARELGCRSLDELMARWVEEHGLWNENDRAWLIAIAVDVARPSNLLVPQAGRHGLRALQGYTNDPRMAMRDEPEAVDEQVLAGGYRAADRREHDAFEERLAERRQLDVGTRLALLRQDATARGAEIDRDIRAIERCLDAAEERVYRPVERITDA